jgi:spermidine synthase
MGFFYAGYIAGAVLGCLLAGFFLLRLYDMPTATYTAVAVNTAVALVALAIASKSPWQTNEDETEKRPIKTVAGKAGVYIAIGLSGLGALGAEVIWTRLLSLTLGATVYTFSIILAMFLLGLGIGSSAGAWWARWVKNPRAALGACQLLVASAVALGAFMTTRSIPYWPIDVIQTTQQAGPWYVFFLDLVRTVCVVLPAAILWGASFPLALAAVAGPGQDPGRMVGGVYAVNTVGAIIGSLSFSMLVIPFGGTQWGQRYLIILPAIAAFAALWPLIMPSDQADRRFRTWKLAGVTAGLAIISWLTISVSVMPWFAVAFGRLGPIQVSNCIPGVVAEQDIPSKNSENTDARYCLYSGEGMNVSVAVTKSTTGYLYFHGAGKVQASSSLIDMRLQRMLGHLSVLARPDPDNVKDVLVVACGAGVTAGSFVPYPNIERITICDIEPLVPKIVTPMFGDQNYHIVDGIAKENPKRIAGKEVRVVYDDGRHYIRTLPKEKKFDIITSDPIDPWVKGCAALNTVEYYEMCKAHLNPGGVMSLWIPIYESDEETIKSVLSTFFQVFPNGMIFSNDLAGQGYDAVLLGQVEPTRIDLDKLHETLNSPSYAPVKQSLMEVGFGAVSKTAEWDPIAYGNAEIDLLAQYAGRAADLDKWMEGAQINRDRNLRLQYLAGMSVNAYVATDILQGILEYYEFPEDIFTGSTQRVEEMKTALRKTNRGE